MNLNGPEKFLTMNEEKIDKLFDQTKSRQRETLEFKIKNSKQNFSFIIPLKLEKDWMMGVSNS